MLAIKVDLPPYSHPGVEISNPSGNAAGARFKFGWGYGHPDQARNGWAVKYSDELSNPGVAQGFPDNSNVPVVAQDVSGRSIAPGAPQENVCRYEPEQPNLASVGSALNWPVEQPATSGSNFYSGST